MTKWYRFFLSTYNAKTIISKDVWCDNFSPEIYSDARRFAFAAFLGRKWIQGSFPDNWKNVNIAIMEFIPVYLAFKLWFKDSSDISHGQQECSAHAKQPNFKRSLYNVHA